MKFRRTKRTGQSTPVKIYTERFTRLWCITATAVIVIWTLWALLDAFVIPRDIVKADPQDEVSSSPAEESQEAQAEPEADVEADGEAPNEALTEPVITDTSYDDGQIYIEISYLRTLDTDVYLADVIINDPAFLKTALAEGAFGRNLTDTTSNIAEQNGAIFAVNGDYYGFRDTGYVMRNGYLYRSVPGKDPEQEDLVLYEDGTVRILRESEYTAEEIRDSGAVDVFSFGPGLVIDGEVSVSSGDEVERAQVTNPRTAFGVISPLHYLFVVSDGRTDESTADEGPESTPVAIAPCEYLLQNRKRDHRYNKRHYPLILIAYAP